jgi:hypothetical protein
VRQSAVKLRRRGALFGPALSVFVGRPAAVAFSPYAALATADASRRELACCWRSLPGSIASAPLAQVPAVGFDVSVLLLLDSAVVGAKLLRFLLGERAVLDALVDTFALIANPRLLPFPTHP